MRNYELMIIYNTEEKGLTEGLEHVKNFFQSHNVEIINEKDYGMRDLAYPIEKKKRGHYYLFNIKTEQANLAKINKDFKLYKPILRYLILKQEA
ncbi:MAG TPA: 30S ribosomal protein S6 [Spirochaetota bacterium]|nr:30S ribosomal protein S6 [Spirochaetota bacterium]HOL56393.1 30S ribosomal protein S6 [Spirochaetota bacterium]HPP05276.1 30S ribosomal protein S6 [Spirochaetota bacterium]